MENTEIKKGILWEYVGGTFFIAVCYTLFSNSIDYSSGVPSYGNLTLTTAAFIGQFLGALLVPSVPAVICSFLTKRYKIEKLLFFIALFIYVINGSVKVNLPLQYLLGAITLIALIFVIKKYGHRIISSPVGKVKSIYYLYTFIGSVASGILWVYLIQFYFYEGESFFEFIRYFNYSTNIFQNVWGQEVRPFFSLKNGLNNFAISFSVTLILTVLFLFNKNGILKGGLKSYLLHRKKNITLSIILIPLIKVLLHFIFNPIFNIPYTTSRYARINRPNRPGTEPTVSSLKEVKLGLEEHLYSSETGELIVFTESLYLYIPAVIVFAIFVWIFNDKIKAR